MSSISSASSRMTTLTAVEAEAAALEVVDRAAGRGDDDVDAAPQAAQLLADRLAAVDRQDAGADARGRTSWSASATCIASSRVGTRTSADVLPSPACADRDALERRQREGRRLARPGRGLGEQVAAGQQRRDRLALDGRRLLVAEGARSCSAAGRRARAPRTRRLSARWPRRRRIRLRPARQHRRRCRPRPHCRPRGHRRRRTRSARPGDRLEVDRPDAARPARIGADGGRRDDARRRGARSTASSPAIQAGPGDPDPAADLEVLAARRRRSRRWRRGSGGPSRPQDRPRPAGRPSCGSGRRGR